MATELELAREAMLDVTAALMVVKPADELSRTLLERAIGTLGRREHAIARELGLAPEPEVVLEHKLHPADGTVDRHLPYHQGWRIIRSLPGPKPMLMMKRVATEACRRAELARSLPLPAELRAN